VVVVVVVVMMMMMMMIGQHTNCKFETSLKCEILIYCTVRGVDQVLANILSEGSNLKLL
jgi:hypothetical protein